MTRRRTPLPVLLVLPVVLVLLGGLLAGCSGSSPTAGPAEPATTSPDPSTSAPATSAPATSAPAALPAPARPERGTCRRLAYDQVLAPTDAGGQVGCGAEHTSETYAVGELRTTVGGHLLAVDAASVQQQPATTCPARLREHVGGTQEDLRLSVLRAVWFTPTVEESDAGAAWFRCDVVAVAREGELAQVRGRLRGVLDTPEGRDRFGLCGTARPGDPDFERTICRAPHTWRAIGVVDLARPRADGTPRDYPGVRRVRAAGQEPCDAQGRDVAADALDYQWGWEWPTAEQWAAGQTWGRCWAPAT